MNVNKYSEIYQQGYEDGTKSVLRLVNMILKDASSASSPSYFRRSLETLLEVYNYGKEKEEN